MGLGMVFSIVHNISQGSKLLYAVLHAFVVDAQRQIDVDMLSAPLTSKE